jgi:hypothetical protein
MFSLAAEHPVLSALVLLSVGWFATFLRKGYKVRRTLHDQVGSRLLADSRCGERSTDGAVCSRDHHTHGSGVT